MLDPAVAVVRLAVRRSLADVGADPVLVACSGGADSLALLAATIFEARRKPWHVVGVTVDHGLQDDSRERADEVVVQMAGLGAHETAMVRVEVTASGQGPEAAAREARYAMLSEIAERAGSTVVLLGHTRDDQAETVLLGLTRGSGGRSVAGMRPAFQPYRRPLLEVTRVQTEAACRAEGIDFWRDPHNEDPRFTRARIRQRVMPMLEEELGPGVAAALARTAEMLREDVESLDDTAEWVLGQYRFDEGLDITRLATLSAAVRLRVLRLAALRAGSPPGELFRVHVQAIDELVGSYHGQLRVELPGHVHVVRRDDRLRFRWTGAGPG
ncbi:MAG: tRNA lysidine(34) synthetase TilS [Actinomycetota bacterium]|nr:tRNA lysidine(34) synthetase TilS [Actinomycetota bacterium]